MISPDWQHGNIRLFNCDCLDFMRELPDKAYKLACVDPPYGIGACEMQLGKWGASRMPKKGWDSAPPDTDYFDSLKRASVNQIICGGNYFPQVWPSRGFVVWDKGAGFRSRDFAECELLYTSFDRNALIFDHDPLANRDYHGKIHPTQKPVKLYKWLLKNYAKAGDTILDTHGGSMSSVLACHDLGFPIDVCELDKDYFAAAVQRIERHVAQGRLF